MSNGGLAGLPRLVRASGELRWRGGSAFGAGVAAGLFWIATWLVGEAVDPLWTGIAAAAVGLPTFLGMALTSPRRVELALRDARRPPGASVYETPSSARERRTRLAAIVLTGVVVLLVFDRVTGGGGVMAGLVAGLFMALGVSDLRDGARFGRSEAGRSTRIFFLLPAVALSARFGVARLYEEAGEMSSVLPEATPFDL